MSINHPNRLDIDMRTIAPAPQLDNRIAASWTASSYVESIAIAQNVNPNMIDQLIDEAILRLSRPVLTA